MIKGEYSALVVRKPDLYLHDLSQGTMTFWASVKEKCLMTTKNQSRAIKTLTFASLLQGAVCYHKGLIYWVPCCNSTHAKVLTERPD